MKENAPHKMTITKMTLNRKNEGNADWKTVKILKL